MFVATLAEACAKADWQVHAHGLMGNHFHLVLETPKGTARTAQIPAGQWKADDGTLLTGPVQKTFTVPLGRLLYFERQERP